MNAHTGPAAMQCRESGFTLIEVLVASAIAALAMGVLLHGALGGIRSVQVSGQYEEAITRAKSHLASLDSGNAIVTGDRQGDDGQGFHWRMRITALASAPIAVGDENARKVGPHVTLYGATVLISWQTDGVAREVRLETQRVAAAVLPAS